MVLDLVMGTRRQLDMAGPADGTWDLQGPEGCGQEVRCYAKNNRKPLETCKKG